MPCSDHAVLLKATAQHGRLSTAVLCCGLEKNGMVRTWHGRGMANVNQTTASLDGPAVQSWAIFSDLPLSEIRSETVQWRAELRI